MDYFIYFIGFIALILFVFLLSEFQISLFGGYYTDKKSLMTKFLDWFSVRYCRHSGFLYHLEVYDEKTKYIDFDANGMIETNSYVQVKYHCTKCKKTFLAERKVRRNKWTNKVVKLID